MTTTKKLPAEVIFNTTVCTIEYLVDLLGVSVTRTTLRSKLYFSDKYPVVSLDHLCKVLNEWGVKNLVLRADINIVKQINLPALAYLPGGQSDLGVFIVITGITEKVIYYFLAGSGLQKESLNDFEQKWGEGILVPLEVDEDQNGERFFLEAKENEDKLKFEYKRSIQVTDNFLSNEECDFIINYCESNKLFSRSKVDLANGVEDVVHPVRTSSSAVIEDRALDVIQKINSKVSEVTNSDRNLIENIQCVRYSPNEQFGLHFDSDSSNKRIYTLLIYLNDDYTQGETHFPELNYKVTPKKGRCLMFKNLDEEYDKVIFSVHAGLPIKSGTKYACNIWVRY